MLQSEHEAFTGLMENLSVIFKRDVDEQMIALFWDALKDQPFTKVRLQVEKHIRYGKHFPRPSELREPPRKAEPAPLTLIQQTQNDDGFDRWAKSGNMLLLKYITTRVPLDTRRYGDSKWTPQTRLVCAPNMHERIAILVAHKNAWVADMREEEAISGEVGKQFSTSNWTKIMELAECEVNKLIARDHQTLDIAK